MRITERRAIASLFFALPLTIGIPYGLQNTAGISAGLPFGVAGAAMVCLIGLLIVYRRTVRLMPLTTYLPVLYLALCALAAIRSIASGTVASDTGAKVIAACMLLSALALWLINSRERGSAVLKPLRALAIGCFIYAAANVLLFALGLTFPTYRPPAVMLQAVGIPFDRVHFIAAPGINAFGFIGGFCFVSGLAWLLDRRRLLGASSIVVGIAVILLTDSRGAALAAFASLVTLSAARVAPRRLSAMLFATIPITAVAVVLLGAASGLTTLTREGEDISSSRGLVWTAALNLVSSDPSVAVTGLGLQGYSNGIAWLQPTAADGALTLHNSYLESLLDVGILGPLLLIWTAYLALAFLFPRHASPVGRWGLALLSYIMVVSAFEVVLSPTHPFFPLAIAPLILFAILRNSMGHHS